jgi:hypothetical protein
MKEFWKLCGIEPRLRDLYNAIPTMVTNEEPTVVWQQVYHRLDHMVGSNAVGVHPALCTSAAWEVAYPALYDLFAAMVSK